MGTIEWHEGVDNEEINRIKKQLQTDPQDLKIRNLFKNIAALNSSETAGALVKEYEALPSFQKPEMVLVLRDLYSAYLSAVRNEIAILEADTRNVDVQRELEYQIEKKIRELESKAT